MTENEWLVATDPLILLKYILNPRSNRPIGGGNPDYPTYNYTLDTWADRKLRLFNCACARDVWDLLDDDCCRSAVVTAERYTDNAATQEELSAAYEEVEDGLHAGEPVADPSRECCAVNNEMVVYAFSEAAMLAQAEGNRYAPILRDIFGNPLRPVSFDPRWRTADAVAIAASMNGSRDFSSMPILGDALAEAGCEHSDILDHCRGNAPHFKGCWVVDLVLGKE